MKRYASLALLLLASSPVAAQDIALSQILIEGQGWQPAKEVQDLFKGSAGVMAANGFRYKNEQQRAISRSQD